MENIEKVNMDKNIIYYTDNLIEDPIKSVVRECIKQSGLPIVSCSLNEPIDFGKNYTVLGDRGYTMMVQQILTCLEISTSKYVFFCEHDVLYPKSHFDFTPSKDNIFYYNANVWRWEFGSAKAIRYDRMLPLSSLCVNREYALDHYKLRMNLIEQHIDQLTSNEPEIARKWGYEPGTKKKKRGGVTDDDFDTWYSKEPTIDIRHRGTFSPPKVKLSSFKHEPKNWQEISINEIPYWDLKGLFK